MLTIDMFGTQIRQIGYFGEFRHRIDKQRRTNAVVNQRIRVHQIEFVAQLDQSDLSGRTNRNLFHEQIVDEEFDAGLGKFAIVMFAANVIHDLEHGGIATIAFDLKRDKKIGKKNSE